MRKYIDTEPVIDWLDDGIKDPSISEDKKEAYRQMAAMMILDIPAAKVREDVTARIEAREIGTLLNRIQTTFYYCGNCHTVVQPTDNFCSRCGARLVKGETE